MFELKDSIFIDKTETLGGTTSGTMPDSAIVDLYFARDERAISETQSKYDKYLRTVSGNIIHNSEDVSECVNDTYLGAWNAIPPTRPNVFRIFLAKITRNLSIKKLRAANAEKRGGGEATLTLDELMDCIADGSKIDENLEVEELTKLIEAFLSSKNEADRRIFLCRYWYFDSIKDISERFDYTESKVKMTLKRTRDELREYLVSQGVMV